MKFLLSIIVIGLLPLIGLSKEDFIKLLSENKNELVLWGIHGGQTSLWFNTKFQMKSGKFDDLSITTAFLLPHSCWIGNYMANRYLAGALLFSKKSEVLALIPATVPIRIWLRNLFVYPFLKGKSFGDSYLSYLKSISWNHDFNSHIIKYDERARVILGDGTLKRQRFILKQDQSELEKNILRSKQLRKIITPSFVIQIVDALRFYPDQSKIYWDKYYIDEYLNYRLEKAKNDGSSYVVYEGINTIAIDNNINN